MSPIRAIKTLNRFRNTGLALVVLLVAWSLWLPYFVPIISIRASQVVREGDRISFDINTQKYLPCLFVRGTIRLHVPGYDPVPVRLLNAVDGKVFGSGALKTTKEGEEYQDFPLFWSLTAHVYVELPPTLPPTFEVGKSYFSATFVYRCNSFNNEYHQTFFFPSIKS